MKKKIILLLVSLSILLSCSTVKYRRKLPQDIRAWYDVHRVLMETKVPKWIVSANLSEGYCFLRLPEKAQRFYIANFWKVRQEGLAEVFYSQHYTANRLFSTEGKPGWRTDRGNVLRICGYPYWERKITIYDLEFRFSSNPRNRGIKFNTPAYDTDGTVYIIWTYQYRGSLVNFTFKYKTGGGYESFYNNVTASGYQVKLMKGMKNIYTPTKDGWDLISGWVSDWTKEMEK